MPVDRDGVEKPSFAYAHYPAPKFTTLSDALVRAMTERQVGRNGWSVMMVLSKMTHINGSLGIVSAERISEQTGLTLAQVARGMRDLRQKKIIAPVIRKSSDGYRHPDKSSFRHVAQYCICRSVWEQVELKELRKPNHKEKDPPSAIP